MQPSVTLVKPTAEYEKRYNEFYEDWVRSGEDIVPWVVEKDPSDFAAMLEFLYSQDSEEKLTEEGWVPHSTYWLLNEEQELVGAVNIRHRLNPKLLRSGGHIGYGIRPSRRRKGYATALLSLALLKTKELGVDQALVVCDRDNAGSERTILKNGGVFESEHVEENGNMVKRFWISLR
ncbi:GNAT family N-acetyltransferase [Paenibacillus sp. GYB004]|uniref:GNAT family N-acetyltransferase n=1 Tax=Paenibacillus sp. GYB004 TaxID=2994393 RepID=UPI002F961632